MTSADSFLLLLNRAGGGKGVKFRAWHGRSLGSHERERDTYRARSYSFLSLSLHGTISAPRYSAVMIERDFPVEQRDWSLLTSAEFQQVFDEQAAQGFGPILIAATGPFEDPRFAVVFEPQRPIALTRHRLRSGLANDESTIQGMNAKAKNDGLVLRWAAAYGNSAGEGFAAIWVPNTGRVVWNADGVLETHAQYQSRFDAQVSGWCRPAVVTLNEQQRYLSLFVENDIGPWVASHGMTGSSYQAEFDDQIAKGFFPTCVQGSGAGSATRYAAIFAKRFEPVPRQFTATGPVTNGDIDDVIFEIMSKSPVSHASLAIVHGKELVYAKGYSYGEPDWPLVQPTTRFRIASVSKLMGALATYQLLKSAGQGLRLDTRVQDILQLQTPTGATPTDPEFGDITVQHLLEYTSGVRHQAHWEDINIRDAFRAARPGETWDLPVTVEMVDAYVASLRLGFTPGDQMAYSGCGYYLLGRLLAKIRGRSSVFDALRDFLFLPLDMTRSRPAPSLISTTPWNEARYRGDDIPIRESVMTDDQPLVPLAYGSTNLANSGCGGGLSMAATDLGRIVAVLLSDGDTPALQQSKVEWMMDNAVISGGTWARSGHGWDQTTRRRSGELYARKGGGLATSGTILQIDGEWGFAVCMGGKATAAAGWNRDLPAVMDVAKTVTWSPDLFPEFGMAPLP